MLPMELNNCLTISINILLFRKQVLLLSLKDFYVHNHYINYNNLKLFTLNSPTGLFVSTGSRGHSHVHYVFPSKTLIHKTLHQCSEITQNSTLYIVINFLMGMLTYNVLSYIT